LECLVSAYGFSPTDAREVELEWNLNESDKFSVDSMYRVLVLPDESVLNNKKIWKMKIPLRPRLLRSIYVEGRSSLRITLQNTIDMEVISVSFAIRMRL
jgi:hypothetical protein